MEGRTDGRMDRSADGWMDGRMDVQIPPVFYRTLSPLVPSRAAAQKGQNTNKSRGIKSSIYIFNYRIVPA